MKNDVLDARGPDARYAAALAAGRWEVQRCNACRQVIFFPRTACPHCGSADYDWFAPSGRGVVHATTVMRRPAKAGGDLHLCLVDLEEGFRMMSRVEEADPASVAIGDRVAAYVGQAGETPLVLFRMAGDAQ
ncbi:DNA-binding protein [Bordetella genomosp. 10]|uniref:DNA-binding protein n=1 Tax=Bordetella genomosp. 10 TaxID=1416804 RepID=A0A261S9G8_9BORD|nr:zinc ribbon domain-containing protein [Bordetella genomosp. 10]OZI34024.1 DNA-binding protein [Bordetella genomosp. 10]